MSLLLDALNKADQERKRHEAMPGIDSHHEQPHDDGHRKIIPLILLTIAIILVALAAIMYWKAKTPTTITQPTNSFKITQPPHAQHELPTVANSQTPVSELSKTNDSETLTDEDDKVANLYQQNAPSTANATLTISTPASADDSATNKNTRSSATQTHASSESIPPVETPTSIAQFSNLPELHDLPSGILEKIPSLNYSEHNYNANGGSVKINGVMRHANEQIANGVVIDKILEDGMILHIDNYAFKMRALNSWVNM